MRFHNQLMCLHKTAGRHVGHNRNGPKRGGAVTLSRELGPRLAQCGVSRGLLPYQAASSSIQPFGRNRYGPKIGRGSVPLWGGELGPHLIQCGQGRGLPACQVSSWSIQPFGHNTATSQTDRQTGQRSDSIGRTVVQTVALKPRQLSSEDLFWNRWGRGGTR